MSAGKRRRCWNRSKGSRGDVRVKPPYPAVSGLYGRPTVVSNVLTFAIVPGILARGGAWHASMGTEHSRGTVVPATRGPGETAGHWSKSPSGSRCGRCWINSAAGWRRDPGSRRCRSAVRWGACFPNHNSIFPSVTTHLLKAGAHSGPWGHRRLRSRDRYGGAGAALYGLHRRRILREMHALPDRVRRGGRFLNGFKPARARTKTLTLLVDLGDTMKAASLCAFGGRAPYPVLTAIEHFPGGISQQAEAVRNRN